MQVDLRTQIVLTVTQDELRLITQGLRGIIPDADKPKALALNVSLCHSRHNKNIEASEVSAKALAGAEAIAPKDEVPQ